MTQADNVLPLSDPCLLAEFPVPTQRILRQAVFHRRLREVSKEHAFRARFIDAVRPLSVTDVFCAANWEMLAPRRRIFSILRPKANAFLRARPDEEPFCPQEVWSVMMRLYLNCYVNDDSAGPELAHCGHCVHDVLDRMGIHATTACHLRWGRVARHDRLTTIFLHWLAAKLSGRVSHGSYSQGEARGLLFGTASRPADALIFPATQAPVEPADLPTAINFMASGALCMARASYRTATRRAAESSDRAVDATANKKLKDYRKKMAAAWDIAYPDVPLPGSHPSSTMPAGGLDEIKGFKLKPEIFDAFGGCSEDTERLIMDPYSSMPNAWLQHKVTRQKEFLVEFTVD